MPKLSDLDQILSNQVEGNDLMYLVDSSETDPDLRSKKITMTDVIASIKAISGTDLGEWIEVNNDYTVVGNKQIYINVFDDQDITITFPSSPPASSQIIIVVNRQFGAEGTIFINLNGQKYNYNSYINNIFIGEENIITKFLYVNSNVGWMSDPVANYSRTGSPYTHVLKYTGTGATRDLPALPFDPDLVIIKNDTDGRHWVLSSTSFNGNNWSLFQRPSEDGGYYNDASRISSYSSKVFTLGTNLEVNENLRPHMLYAFKKDIDLGFNIVSYKGNGSSQSISHGLRKAPTFYIIKGNGAAPWVIYHKTFADLSYTTNFDGSSMLNGDAANMRPQRPDEDYVYVGATNWVNASSATDNYSLYAWTDTLGVFSSGEYIGTGFSNNGPNIDCGFTPSILWIKPLPIQGSASTQTPLQVFDNVLNAPSPITRCLKASTGSLGTQQGTNFSQGINLTSDGFQVLENVGGTYNWLNTIGVRYIYMAWS